MVYLAGGFTHALNDVLHERERLGVPLFKLAKDHWYPPGASPFLGVGAKLYAICLERNNRQLRGGPRMTSTMPSLVVGSLLWQWPLRFRDRLRVGSRTCDLDGTAWHRLVAPA